ncbi:MAG: sn-glycerol-3-phosphate ABC transporter ATP-binding protein UgpC, partial [Rhizobium sp.]|nr:sn-glycerol-3-phosphate ABC transporter ATP-binding protein UgpC [Rhizobium sp.]
EGDRLVIGDVSMAFGAQPGTTGAVTVGVRAEDLTLAGEDDQRLPFKVDYVEELGAHRLVHGHLSSQALTAVIPVETEIAEEMSLTVSPERLHFFAKETGRRIDRPASPMPGGASRSHAREASFA